MNLRAVLGRIGSDAFETAASLKRYYFNHSEPCSLEVDYAGLFVGPFIVAAPPYGSVYLENKRQLMGDSTIDARRHYLSLGLDLSPDFKEAPDHICAELEFMHVLISQGAEAIDAGDYDQLAEIVGHQQVFLEKHLAAWIPAFTAKIIDHARTDYYRHLGELTRQFIAEEMDASQRSGCASTGSGHSPVKISTRCAKDRRAIVSSNGGTPGAIL